MKRIQAPDGAILEFPDDMADDAILGVMQKEYPDPNVSTGQDMLAGAKAGLAQGTAELAGQPRDLASLVARGGVSLAHGAANKIRGLFGLAPNPDPTPEQLASLDKSVAFMTPLGGAEENKARIESVTGPLPDAQTTAGKYAQSAARFVPGALLTPTEGPVGAGTLAINAFKYGVVPGLTSEAAGQATEGTKAEPYARIAGALAGSQLTDIAKRVVSPNPITPDRKKLVDVLKGENVDLTAGQKTGNKGLQYLESASGQVPLGGGKARAISEAQGEQFTKAALSKAGINAERATPEVIDAAFERLGKEFDTLAGATTIKPDQKLGMDLFGTLSDYMQKTSATERKPYIQNLINEITAKAQSGFISGDFYKSTRSAIERLRRGTSDPEFNGALADIRGALDDAVERSISPDLVDRWRDVRNQYRNVLPLERAATAAGENAAQGIVSPSALKQAVLALHGRRNYARGSGDFADLARAGEGIMRPLPDSGTAGRTQAFRLLDGMGLASGGAAGALLSGGNTAGTVAGALAGQALAAGVPAVASRALMSSPVQAYLGNQVISSPSDPARVRLLQALMAADAARREPTR